MIDITKKGFDLALIAEPVKPNSADKSNPTIKIS